ncbi:alcohol dehydrogenase NADP [Nesidiocoris tenuis]|uniref:Alcohol dehydrogenase NADP n=1 Tax=Nesidiocoris tenuis TaxID=355587 RepID=A0ABN7AHR5_9HEMI|nr:alcohol dehydrogenase NADP [Nesidiocoris tenuis]
MAIINLLTLNAGNCMPAIGFGTWQANGESLEAALNWAFEAGYRHIDTATVYQNEEIVGKVINEWISSGRLRRDELFVVTKLPPSGNSPKGVDRFVKESLTKLKLDYIDLYLIHVPFGFKEDGELHPFDSDGNVMLKMDTNHLSIWNAFERHVRSGKLRAIGLSNFNKEQVERVWANSTIKPSVLQIEMHLFLQQRDLVEYCKSRDIVVTAYSPLGTRGMEVLLRSIGSSKEIPDLQGHPEVLRIAKCLGKTPAQILLRFLLDRGVAVIPKSTSKEHIKENIQVFDFEIGEEHTKSLQALDQQELGRIVDFTFLKGSEKHPEFPFRNV